MAKIVYRVQDPTVTSGSCQLLLTPAQEIQCPLLASMGIHMHVHTDIAYTCINK